MSQSVRAFGVPASLKTGALRNSVCGLCLTFAGVGYGAAAHAAPVLPTGGSVTAGSAVIAKPNGSTLQITQTSANAIIDWSSFSIGQAGAVQINNGAGATLNRVTGGQSSSINGLLNATGSVYLINPSGVVIGKTGVVNVGGTFVASTLDIGDKAFRTGGNLTFSGASTSQVVNLGSIGALGGDVVLIANSVINRGTLSAPNGDVGLLSGTTVLLQDTATDDGKFIVQVGAAGGEVVNSGGISAAVAELRANGGNVYALAGNTTGVINATGVSSLDGQVFLVAEGGEVTAKGSISAVHADGSGGEVQTIGTSVNVAGVSVTSGAWLVGSDSLTVTPAMASTFSQNLATTSIVLQSTGATTLGDLTINGRIAWTGANTLTLDAANDIVVSKAMSLLGGGLNLVAPNGSITIDAPITVKGAGAVSLAASETDGILNLGFGLTDAGFAGSLSFQRHDQKYQSLTINGHAYTLLYSYVDGGFTGKRDMDGIDNAGDGGDYALADNVSGSGIYNPVAGHQYIGDAYTFFYGVFEGLGHRIENVDIVSTQIPMVGVFSVNSGTIRDIGVVGGYVNCVVNCHSAGGLVGENIGNFGPAVIVNSYATDSVGAEIAGGLVGVNDASNYNATIDNTFATGIVGSGGGLVGYSQQSQGVALIINSHASGAVTEGGGLIGVIQGGTLVENDYATGNVSYGNYSGGLIGYADGGTLINVYATGSVSNAYSAGGLIGYNNSATVNTAYATGSVSGSNYAGGLEGTNLSGVVTNAYATGAVTSGEYAGGLVGYNTATPGTLSISNTYAIGKVEGVVGGGLVGYNDGGLIDTSYWDRSTTGRATDGQTIDSGVDTAAGLTTTQLQHGGAHFTGSAFAGGAKGVYSYLVALPPSATP